MGLRMLMQLVGVSSLLGHASMCLASWSCQAWQYSAVFSLLLACLVLPCVLVALLLLDIARRSPADSHNIKSLALQYIGFQFLPDVFGKRDLAKLRHLLNDCGRVQEQTLLKRLKQHSKCLYGRHFKLGEIKDREDFVQKHPLTDYAHYEKYVEKVADGEENIMTDQQLLIIALSSGTTGKTKMYPVFSDLFKWLPGVMGTPLRQHPSFYRAFGLQRIFEFKIFHPPRVNHRGIKMGGIGSLISDRNSINLVPDVFLKIHKEHPSFYAQAVFALAERELGHIQGFSSDLMFSLFSFIMKKGERMAVDIEQGFIAPYPDIPEDIRKELNTHMVCDPIRAAFLRQEFSKGSFQLAKRVWPGIVSVNVAKTGSFAHCSKLLAETYLNGVPMNFFAHGATEGVFGLQLEEEPESDVYTMVPHICFLEFIPVEHMEEENPKTYFMDQLDVGQCYEVVVTNTNGLYRNRFGDVIKVIGHRGNTPTYRFMYRTGQILNVAFDRTPEKAVLDAVTGAQARWGGNIRVDNYTATESFQMEKIIGESYDTPCYMLFVEMTAGSSHVITQEQLDMCEEELLCTHETYGEYREQGGLGPMKVFQVKQGTFEKVRHALFGDRPNNQFKAPRVQRKQDILQLIWDNIV